MPTPESIARENIDAQLSAAGWTVQDLSQLNLSASRGVAIREVRSQGGPADYILFVDGKALGVVEAKKEGTTLSSVAEQSTRYTHARKWIPQRWADPLPFTYESTGVETNFRDQRDPDSRSRSVFAFHTPEHLLALVQQPDTLRERLQTLPANHPLVIAPLRDCQVSAITGLEESLADNRPRALLQMATGSGKTYTAVTQAYRLIKHAGAQRILFLVDRGNLGRQTINEFQQFTTPDDGRKFTDLYNVQMLGPGGIDPVCKVTVSTIQRLFSQLKGTELDEEADEISGYEFNSGCGVSPQLSSKDQSQDGSATLPVTYNPRIPIETFDFVIIDECHRSIYNLWRQVLDYFDAFLIGLTATPSKATLGFFDRNLVTEYPHVQAVADGVNVGYDIYRIKTKISEEGTTLDAGFDYQKRDRLTREKRWAIQDEEQTIAKTQLDRSVVVPDQIRTVIRTFREKLFTDLFPGRSGDWVPKTLIFAKTDEHAEDIVNLVREEFGKGNDFCKKVTYKAGGKPEDIIKAFRTAPEFRIAVTVDMIATGTDIKPLECLLFLRDVRSQLYFEQMKGRGTRTIDATDLAIVTPDAGSKTRFVLVDAVGVTESDKTDSRPLERKPTVPFDKLLQSVALGLHDEDTLTSLANRLARLDRSLSDSDKEELQATGGLSLKQLASHLLQATDPDTIEKVAETSRLSSPEAEKLQQEAATTFNFFNQEAETIKTQGASLPQGYQDGVIYFVTFRLADSLPQEKLKVFASEKELWLKQNPEPHTAEQKAEYHERFPQRLQQWLDLGYGSMILKDAAANQLVCNAITHFDGDRYQLDEFVVAANHVHILVAPQGDHSLSEILHSWKSFTAKELLKLPIEQELTTAPTVWQKESWDHIVRSEASLNRFREYIRAHKVAEASCLRPSWEDLQRDAAATLANKAVAPVASNPAYRDLLEKKRRDREVTIDHLTGDEVISAGYDEEKARQLVTSWKTFLDDNQDEITALQILYNKPHAKRHLVYEELKALADAIARPPYHIAPAEVWSAYEHLEKRPLTRNPVKTLTNLITLVRHTVDPTTTPLAPFPELVEQRYQAWLTQQQTPTPGEAVRSEFTTQNSPLTTPRFTESQIKWLSVIRDYIALNGAFATDDQSDYLEAWQSVDSDEGVPLAVAKRVFGQDPKPLIEELNEVLVA
ncbi:DEAD/DEAH box helicase family protein [Roseibacillus persicicus]|uniref:DEAD/DEAH box helicase family protein n=1 Tax=Roseibacillus persicicus TaxID=454148 RepID=UPI00398AFDAB